MSTYSGLMKAGWRMSDIDGMDFPGFMTVRAWELSRENEEITTPDGKVYIDDIF